VVRILGARRLANRRCRLAFRRMDEQFRKNREGKQTSNVRVKREGKGGGRKIDLRGMSDGGSKRKSFLSTERSDRTSGA